VRNNLEAVEYAVGAMPIEAASAGADHFRDRCWFVAHSSRQRGNRTAIRSKPAGRSIAAGDCPRALPYGDNAEQRPDDSRGNIDVRTPAGWIESASDIAERGACDVVDDPSFGWGEGWTEHEFRSRGFAAPVASVDGCQYVECPDGKWRRLPPPRVRWLGNGIPARVAKLRALGNAIDPRPAAEFIRASREAIEQVSEK
jgi:DNA (cytosine-5)-methyltransferase 1